ncbi:hypothetical protein CEXT_495711, partial [Caerostris extrusa]
LPERACVVSLANARLSKAPVTYLSPVSYLSPMPHLKAPVSYLSLMPYLKAPMKLGNKLLRPYGR